MKKALWLIAPIIYTYSAFSSLWFICPFSSYLFIIYSISLTLVLKDFLLMLYIVIFILEFCIYFTHFTIIRFSLIMCVVFASQCLLIFYIHSLFLMGTLLCHWSCRLNCLQCLSSWLFFNESFSGLYFYLIFKVLFPFLATWCCSKGWFIFIYSFIFM